MNGILAHIALALALFGGALLAGVLLAVACMVAIAIAAGLIS